jgi:23S rRNA (uracil1939-C5)-methyltransferase
MTARKPASRADSLASAPADVRISAVGVEADGLAQLPDGTRLFVPLTLPGELVRIHPGPRRGDGRSATVETVLEPSPARSEPPCGHFGTCGGCTLQHWQPEPYLAWKTDLLQAALQRAGYADIPLAPIARSQPAERRRMDLAVRRAHGGAVSLGLHRLRSTEVVDLTECAVLEPTLVALLPSLREVLRRLQALRREASVVANLLDAGPDLLLRTDAALTVHDRTALTEFARAHAIPRIAWAQGRETPETACLLRPPIVSMSGVTVTPPPSAFLQATRSGEAAIVAAVLAALPDKLPPRARVAELYAGCGTLTFALAQRVRVSAWEGDAASIAALRHAANQSGLAGRVEGHPRDLVRQPLQPKELAGFSMLVLDPPHDGASVQMPAIAAAKVPVVTYVSCNPVTLGRDAAVLREAGYRLAAVQPVDQFLWSARLESVAVFVRER